MGKSVHRYGIRIRTPTERGKVIKSATLVGWLCILPSFVLGQDVANPDRSATHTVISQELPTAEQQSPYAQFKVTLSPESAMPGDDVILSIDVTVAEGWHIGAISQQNNNGFGFPTEITFATSGLNEVDTSFSSTVPAEELMVGTEKHRQQSGEFSWRRKYRVANDAMIIGGSGTIRFDASNLPPPPLPGCAKSDHE